MAIGVANRIPADVGDGSVEMGPVAEGVGVIKNPAGCPSGLAMVVVAMRTMGQMARMARRILGNCSCDIFFGLLILPSY